MSLAHGTGEALVEDVKVAFVDKDTMNVDFYRHGKVIVDLGTIKRPSAG